MIGNAGRRAIIEDTTRTYLAVKDPFGDDPQAAGYYIAEICPVRGTEILPGWYGTAGEAKTAIRNLMEFEA